MRYLIIMLFIINVSMAKDKGKNIDHEKHDLKKHSRIMYESTSEKLIICGFNAGVISGCRNAESLSNIIYAADGDSVYMHDMNSNIYQLCKIKEKKVVDCTIALVDSFKVKKMVIASSRLYLLGSNIRSCSIGKNHNIGQCIDEKVDYFDSGSDSGSESESESGSDSGSYYSNVQPAPSKYNGLFLTKKTEQSESKFLCKVENDSISSCSNIKDGNYKAVPGESRRIYRFEPALKRVMICDYDSDLHAASSCVPAIPNFDMVADNMAFTQNGKGALITDVQNKSFIYCDINGSNYKFSRCMHLKTTVPALNTAVIFNEGEMTPPLKTDRVKDGFFFSGIDGTLSALCRSTSRKQWLCNMNKNKIASSSRYGKNFFMRDYLPGDSITSQDAFWYNSGSGQVFKSAFNSYQMFTGAGEFHDANKKTTVVKSQYNGYKINLLSSGIMEGKVWSEKNALFLFDNDRALYQCNYNLKNLLTGCTKVKMETGISNGSQMAFDSSHAKVYFYSQETRQLKACSFIDQGVKNCFTVSIDGGIAQDNVQNVLMTPDSENILFVSRSTIHYCGIDSKSARLKNCVSLSDRFSNVSSIAYSKVDPDILYVLDSTVMKSCSIKNGKINCHEMELNKRIAQLKVDRFSLSGIYLEEEKNYIPVTIKNKGGYNLKVTHLARGGKNSHIKAFNSLKLNHESTVNIPEGTPVELNAQSGHTKCFVIDEAGVITCRGSTLNMGCSYRPYINFETLGEEKKLIKSSCPDSAFGNGCSQKLLKYIKSSGNAGKYCHYWSMDSWMGTIKAQCIWNPWLCAKHGDLRYGVSRYCSYRDKYNELSCREAKKAMDARIPFNDHIGVLAAGGP